MTPKTLCHRKNKKNTHPPVSHAHPQTPHILGSNKICLLLQTRQSTEENLQILSVQMPGCPNWNTESSMGLGAKVSKKLKG